MKNSTVFWLLWSNAAHCPAIPASAVNARQRIWTFGEPFRPFVSANVLDFGAQVGEAAVHCKKALELRPDLWPGPLRLSEIYVMQGRPQDALPEIEQVRFPPARAFLYTIAYDALGRKKEADAELSQLIAKYQASSAYQIAEIYAFRNQPDRAFEWLDRAYAQHDGGLMGTKVEPLLKTLRSDRRFTALLKKLNLPI